MFEIAVANDSEDIVFYVAVPNEFTSLFEKQTLSLFPQAELTVQPHDYNVYMDGGVTQVVELTLAKHPIYPIKSAAEFAADPLEVLLNAFSKIGRAEGAAVQFAVRHPQGAYLPTYKDIIKQVEKGVKPQDAIARSTTGGAIMAEVGSLFFGGAKKSDDEQLPDIDTNTIELFRQKTAKDIVEVTVRLVVSAVDKGRVHSLLEEIKSAFLQFDTVHSNSSNSQC